jgi:tripartite ATP-independent transporter DctP family solute receptor
MFRRRFLVATGAAAEVLPRVPVRAAQFEFRCGHQFAREHPINVRLTQMWESIAAESGGRMHATIFPNSQLGSDSSMFSQLRLGALTMQGLSAGTLASLAPSADIGFLGFAFKSSEEGLRAMTGPLGAYIRDEAARKGVRVLATIWDSGMIQMSSSTHPIRTPRDLTNMKIRVAESPILSGLFKTLGANAVPLPQGELYTALQTRTVDGEAGTLLTMETTRVTEVQRYISLTNHAWSGLWIGVNGEAWNALPTDLQAVVERNNTRYAKLEWRDIALLNGSLADKMARRGLIVNAVDQQPFRALLRPYYEYWSAAFGAAEWKLLESSLGREVR